MIVVEYRSIPCFCFELEVSWRNFLDALAPILEIPVKIKVKTSGLSFFKDIQYRLCHIQSAREISWLNQILGLIEESWQTDSSPMTGSSISSKPLLVFSSSTPFPSPMIKFQGRRRCSGLIRIRIPSWPLVSNSVSKSRPVCKAYSSASNIAILIVYTTVPWTVIASAVKLAASSADHLLKLLGVRGEFESGFAFAMPAFSIGSKPVSKSYDRIRSLVQSERFCGDVARGAIQ